MFDVFVLGILVVKSIVGLVAVLQTRPFDRMAKPPLSVILA